MSMDSDRYSRQMRLPEIGEEGQDRLARATVLVVGLGGLGLPAATYLAGAGVGSITLLDSDVVELHNLHRQVMFTEYDAGKSKAEIAANRLRALNSAICVKAYAERFSSANAVSMVQEHDIVLDCADNFVTTYLLSDTCHQQEKFLVSASLLGAKGYLGVFCHRAPSYRAVFPSPPADLANCNSAGVLGTAVGVLGVMQAQETLKLIARPQQALIGKLLSVDLWNNRFYTMDFSAAEELGISRNLQLLTTSDLKPNDILVDVRSSQEVESNPVHGAFHLSKEGEHYQFESIPSRHGRTVFFCESGSRAKNAAEHYANIHGLNTIHVWIKDRGSSVESRGD